MKQSVILINENTRLRVAVLGLYGDPNNRQLYGYIRRVPFIQTPLDGLGKKDKEAKPIMGPYVRWDTSQYELMYDPKHRWCILVRQTAWNMVLLRKLKKRCAIPEE